MPDVSCLPDDLAEEITCLANQNRQTLLAQIVYLLCQIAEMDCNPDTLSEVSDVRCLSDWNEGMLMGSTVYLLCQIVNGGGGPTCIACHDADPTDGVDVPPCDCSLWITNKDGVPNLWKSSDGITWQAIIWSPI